MKNKTEAFIPESTLHIYNRANGNDRLFVSDNNYEYFLEKYTQYLHPYLETLCYCLMPNHFHFLVRIKDENSIIEAMACEGIKIPNDQLGIQFFQRYIQLRLSHFLNGYAQAFNKQQKRRGSLFMHPTKRKLIDSSEYLIYLIQYIHLNPVDARLCYQPEGWKYSSYNSICMKESALVRCEEVIQLFDDLENFKHMHRKA